jgi:hypothetical protein
MATTKDEWRLTLPPPPGRGRKSAARAEADRDWLQDFAGHLREIRSTLDFRPGKRGWCYLLEEYGLNKGEFDRAEELIDRCRKTGLLPVNFTAEDINRKAENLEDPDDPDPASYTADRVELLLNHIINGYDPGSFWNFQEVYIEMMVEKIDLRELFGPICKEYHVPIFNARGWSDINSRVAMMRRFRRHEVRGDRRCVLLLGGDFDPSGFLITDRTRGNLAELENAVVEIRDGREVPIDWDPGKLTIDRFCLNIDFIRRHRRPRPLTWVDNLQTSSGKDLASPSHPDHKKPYVQDYLRQYGARKVEANALVTCPDAARDLCRQAIEKYLNL